jgi:hypothetical protein
VEVECYSAIKWHEPSYKGHYVVLRNIYHNGLLGTQRHGTGANAFDTSLGSIFIHLAELAVPAPLGLQCQTIA